MISKAKVTKFLFPDEFKIAVNNQHTADYHHRLPLNAAELVTVKGDVTLSQVQIYPGFVLYGHQWKFAMVSIDIDMLISHYLNLSLCLQETPLPINVFPGEFSSS